MDDEWAQLPIDPNTGVKVLTIGSSNPLPVQPQPIQLPPQPTPQIEADPATGVTYPTSPELSDSDLMTGPLAKLFGTAGNERYQLWPEKLIRSAVSAPMDAAKGEFGQIGDPDLDANMVPRALDVASFAGGGMLPMKAGEASLGAGLVRPAASEAAPVFYSAVENAVKDAKLNVGTADQWLGYLKNQPGVKQEELDWTLGDLPTDAKLTKADVQAHVDANKVQINDVNKGNAPATYNDQGYPSGTFPEGSTTKFQSYQLPGGTNYQEKLLTLPDRKLEIAGKALHDFESQFGSQPIPADRKVEWEQLRQNVIAAKGLDKIHGTNYFTSSHWDEPNVLAHVRMNDRLIPKDKTEVNNYSEELFKKYGNYDAIQKNATPEELVKWKQLEAGAYNKTLHLEEIQSDWHQKGRAEGYKITSEQKIQLEGLDKRLLDGLSEKDIGNPDMAAVLKTAQEKGVLSAQEAKNYADWSKGENSSIPNAPFKSSWSDLALKRMIRHASENGYDAISWTPGEAQAARYDLSKQISSIDYQKQPDGTYSLGIFDKSGQAVNGLEKDFKPEELSNVVGKEIAQKIIGDNPSTKIRAGTLEGLDLKVGGEGMKAFYDKMLVDKANNIAKKYGGRVEDKNLLNQDDLMDKYERQGFSSEEALEKAQDDIHELGKQPIHFLKLPQGLKDTALSKGFPLFSGGFPLTPVQGNPVDQSGLDENVNVDGKTIPINNKQDVPDLAGASNNSDTVNIDKSVPRYDPKFVLKNGELGDIHKYLAIHETKEVAKMREDTAAFAEKNGRQPNAEEIHKIYLNAHYGTATPAEHAAIIADGGNPKNYEDVLHGYEKKTENEKNADVPKDLYAKVYSHTQLRNMKMTPIKGNPFNGN